MQLKKQTTALGLLLLVTLPLFLSVGIFIKQKTLQHNRTQRFDTEVLQTISISSEKIIWVKAEKEILVNGKLFDVQSLKTVDNKIILTGFYDNKEDKLVKSISDLVEKKQESNSPLNDLAITFLIYPKHNQITTFSFQNNWQIISCQFPVYAEVIFSMSYPATAPPPKYC